jgi:aspartate aminotransferase-like enzyme
MLKRFLCAPGPTAVPSEVLLDMAKPLIHHRTPQFEAIVEENAKMLKEVFKTSNDVVTFTSSGTGAMEASVVNFLSPGDKIITLNGGKFGERFGEIGRAYGVDVIELTCEWGDDIKPEVVEKTLKENPGVKAVYTEYSETCTGVAFDVKGIAEVVSKTDAILVVDGITAIGAMEFEMDNWGVDVAIAGAQKSLMIPPGLAFLAASPKARAMMESSTLPKFYFNLAAELKALAKKTTSWTPAVSLFIGLNTALKMIIEEGMENVIKRHSIIAEAFRKAVLSIGLDLLVNVPNAVPSNSVTAVKIPDNIDGGKIPKLMRDKYGVTIAGGQAHLKGKIFRLGHLGYTDKSDVVVELQALEYVLDELGFKFEKGKSIGIAHNYLIENLKY